MGKIFEALEKSKHIRSSDGGKDQENFFSGDDQRQMDTIKESTLPMEEPDLDLPQNLNASLVTLTKPNSIEAEQFRLLKNNNSDIQQSSLPWEACHKARDPWVPAPFDGVHQVIKLSETPVIISFTKGYSFLVHAIKRGLSSLANIGFKTT